MPSTSSGQADVLRLAILSDLHAFDGSEPSTKAPSFYDVSASRPSPLFHPVSALHEFLRSTKLSADILLCGGDLGDKSGPIGIKQAWADIQDIGRRIQAKVVAGTCGNHDLDSRYVRTDHDCRGVLMSLTPRFPIDDEDAFLRYWAKNYAVITREHYRLVLLNSCGFHGGGRDTSAEISHGRVSLNTLDWLERDLKVLPPRKLNILLCHHHPKLHPEIDYEDYQVMAGGEPLLRLLGSGVYGAWLVVHGHKHHPKIDYASGGGSKPVVFSAGSFAAHLYPQLTSRGITNQFYLVEIHLDKLQTLGIVGIVNAWDWQQGVGWNPSLGSSAGYGIPNRCGFGASVDVNVLAQEIKSRVLSVPVAWRDVVRVIPTLLYVLPSDLRALDAVLNRDHSFRIVFENGIPRELGPNA